MNANLEGVPANPEHKTKTKTDNHSPEHIGHTLLAVESKKQHVARMKLEKLLEDTKPVGETRNLNTLNRADLLSLSETIMIDGSSLRQIYETHLIGERGLRHLVSEHLTGGDLKKALRVEVVEREMDFERDPALRAVLPEQIKGGNSAKLEELLEKAALNVADSGEEAAFFKAQARYEASQQQQRQQQRQYIDFGIGIVIVILLIIVVLLFLIRG